MKKITILILVVLVSMMLLLTACGKNENNTDTAQKDSTSDMKSNTKDSKEQKGGEKLISVRAEYSYCYATPENYDPTMAFDCVDNLTYKDCMEWKAKEPGQGHTYFYAEFMGGEPLIKFKNANEYIMKVKYAENLEVEDNLVIFPGDTDEFYVSGGDDCYPKATIEVYNMEDKLMGKMSFDNKYE